jgi:hypothetical protein
MHSTIAPHPLPAPVLMRDVSERLRARSHASAAFALRSCATR